MTEALAEVARTDFVSGRKGTGIGTVTGTCTHKREKMMLHMDVLDMLHM